MENIVCYLIVLVSSFLLEINTVGSSNYSVIATLVVIIVTTFYFSFGKVYKRLCKCLIYVIAIALVIAPDMGAYTPVLVYVLASVNMYLGIVYAVISTLVYALFGSMINTCILAIMGAVAVVFSSLTAKIKTLDNNLLKLRDNSKEKELLVEEKNRMLRDNQDANIHLATLKERNRIAREIHDNVGHLLTRSIVQIGAVKTINKDDTLGALLDGVHQTLDQAMNNIRTSVHDLHDESIDLRASIEEILDTVGNFETELVYDMEDVVPKKIKYSFITIIKESVNNAIKHSNGDKIKVLVREHPGLYQLNISDNGKVDKQLSGSGIGLVNIKDRVNELGGSLRIDTEAGFEIMITVVKGAMNND